MAMKNDKKDGAVPTYEVAKFEPRELPGGTYHDRVHFEVDDEVHVRDYVGIVLRRKWIALGFLSAVTALTIVLSLMTTPTFKSTAVIKIDKDASSALSAQGIDMGGAGPDYYQTQYELLKSRALAERVINRLSLDKNTDFLPVPGGWSAFSRATIGQLTGGASASVAAFPSTSSETLQEQSEKQGKTAARDIPLYLSDALISRLTIMPVKNSQLVKISFEANSAEVSSNVANAVARTFIQYDTESRINASRQARDFLEKQAEITQSKVDDSERRLNEYASSNGIIFLDNDKVNINNQKLTELTASLSSVSTERIQKESLYRQIRESGTENPIIMNNPLIQGLAKEHASLEAEYFNLLKTYTPDYPKMKSIRSQMDALRDRMEKEKASITRSLESDYQASLRKERNMSAAFETQKRKVLDSQKKTIEYLTLKREVDVNRELHNTLLQKLNAMGISAMSTATNIQVVDPALVPRRPYKPNILMNFLFSLAAGLAGGIGLTFLVDYLDNSINDTRDLERMVGIPTLGMIPHIEKVPALPPGKSAAAQTVPGPHQRPLVTYPGSTSAVAEAFRSVGTFILLSSAERPPKTILFTSCEEKVGKTTVSINTATALTESLGKGIIIDADLRRPRLHKAFGMENGTGLSTLLSGNIGFEELDNTLIRPTGVKGLSIITSGPVPPNPSELLISARMQQLLNMLYGTYDFIVIDAAPVMGLADPLYLSSIVDGTVLVVKSGETPRKALSEAKKIFRSINAKVLGVVLNGVKEKDLKYGHYNYYYSSYFKE
ncbi:MAG: polysaccharide biosynthesis tyrosine autokinase [Nitrospiraceae bacterium]|nr:polysaccharide biosynthesis tyrosine autokinase [Nitrospiraceae bacterium]